MATASTVQLNHVYQCSAGGIAAHIVANGTHTITSGIPNCQNDYQLALEDLTFVPQSERTGKHFYGFRRASRPRILNF